MSRLYVRQLVKQWLGADPLPFYDTTNLEQAPTDDVWMTVDWGVPDTQRITYCDDASETGTFNLVFLGRAGIGDDYLLDQAGDATARFMAQRDPQGRLTLIQDGAPFDFLQEEWYVVEVQIEYEHIV